MPDSKLTLSIDKEQIASMPVASFQGNIFIADTAEKAVQAVAELSACPIIGFDTETKPSFRKGHPNKMALMQLSTLDTCYLFRLNQTGIVPELADLIQNPDITKIGLSVHDDFHVLQRSSSIMPQGFIELQQFVKGFHISDISLQKIYAIIFGEKISKSQRLTNWEARELTHPQQVYAAMDAWACLRIYNYLMSGQFDPKASPYALKPEAPATSDPTT